MYMYFNSVLLDSYSRCIISSDDSAQLIEKHDNNVYLTVLQLKVLPKDLQLCTERSSGVDSMGQHQWGDMVQLE